jgi:hypothetical protein
MPNSIDVSSSVNTYINQVLSFYTIHNTRFPTSLHYKCLGYPSPISREYCEFSYNPGYQISGFEEKLHFHEFVNLWIPGFNHKVTAIC